MTTHELAHLFRSRASHQMGCLRTANLRNSFCNDGWCVSQRRSVTALANDKFRYCEQGFWCERLRCAKARGTWVHRWGATGRVEDSGDDESQSIELCQGRESESTSLIM